MTWREDYQTGSFRGAAFRTEQHEARGGRRTITHEFPGRDEPLVEDLGRAAKSFSIDVWVGGEYYFGDRDALIDALDQGGTGLLIHPWLGRMTVSVIDWSCAENTEEGGIARFSIGFAESGVPTPAVQTADGNSLSREAADSAIAAAPAAFADRFNVAGLPGFVEDASASLVSSLAIVTQSVAGIGGGTGPALNAFEKGLSLLGVSGLLRAPLDLAHAMIGLVQVVGTLNRTSRRKRSAFARMLAYDPATDQDYLLASGARAIGLTVSTAPTPVRAAEVDNREALLHLYRITASAELVRTIAEASFSSVDEAMAVRADAAGRLDTLATMAADAGEDARAADYDGLRRALVRDIAQRAPMLPQIRTVETIASEPAIVIANRLYGHGDASSLSDDIVARNRVAHPAFVPGGSQLKVIANGR